MVCKIEDVVFSRFCSDWKEFESDLVIDELWSCQKRVCWFYEVIYYIWALKGVTES